MSSIDHSSRAHRRGRLATAGLLALVGALSLCLLPGAAQAKKKHKKPSQTVRVMSRNLYLGADLTPGLTSPDLATFINTDGPGIINQVDATDFPTRAKGLAAEILGQKPDLVGLQEVADWRERTPASLSGVFPPTATTVRYDFLQLLLDKLNANTPNLYRAVVVKPEFDFETPANENGVADDGTDFGATLGNDAEINIRLTMRDVILARKGVKTSAPKSGTYNHLLGVLVGGAVPTDVTRGWTSVDAKVGKGKTFHFVNTHFEAFDSDVANNEHTISPDSSTDVGKGEIRQHQAQELVANGGPAQSKLPVILVGDLNSDDNTVGQDGDQLAYNAIIGAGFKERSTANPLGCCLSDPNLTGGSIADFDHQVDHILTDTKAIKFIKGAVTGRQMVNGLWDSDHNGIASVLSVPAKGKKK